MNFQISTLARRGHPREIVRACRAGFAARFISGLALFAGPLCLLSGCYDIQLSMKPVNGPLASQPRPRTLQTKIFYRSHRFSMAVTLPGGEVCSAIWTPAPPSQTQSPATGLQPLWEDVYGFVPSFYATHIVTDRSFMRVKLSGNQGTTLNLELWDTGSLKSTFVYGTDRIGVAADSKGNVFKITGPSAIPIS